MDPTRFDRLTRTLGTARSRRALLAALGGALAGALTLPGAAHAATPEACRQAWGDCRNRASATMSAGIRACQAGPAATRDACLLKVRDEAAQAQRQCEVAYAQCLETPVVARTGGATCQAVGQPCDGATVCCPGLTCGRPSPFDPGRCR